MHSFNYKRYLTSNVQNLALERPVYDCVTSYLGYNSEHFYFKLTDNYSSFQYTIDRTSQYKVYYLILRLLWLRVIGRQETHTRYTIDTQQSMVIDV